ncbi:MAG: ribosome-associated protein [Acidimicrobiaceae bacterium]
MADRSDRWPVLAAQAASSKKGIDPVVLAVGDVLAITDFFVIVSATNTRLVRTLADEVEQQIREAGGPKPLRTEGLDDLHWVLVDYGAFVVHVFLQETRDYYELERLWSDVPRVEWEESAART